jgi:hypothetical protein
MDVLRLAIRRFLPLSCRYLPSDCLSVWVFLHKKFVFTALPLRRWKNLSAATAPQMVPASSAGL